MIRSIRLGLSFLLFALASGCTAAAQRPAVPSASNYRLAADYSKQARGLSMLVMVGDKVVFEEYHNGHSADTPWLLASGTKSFSGVMLAAAIDDKLIGGFDEKVADTITEWKGDPRLGRITYRQLLSLTSGIDVGQNLRPPAYAAAVKHASVFEPGSKFQYGPAPFQIFGEVMRRKLLPRRETVLDYLKRRVLDPIGLRVARWDEQEGQPDLPSGAYLTAREWAKFGMLLKNTGKWNGKQVIKADLLKELTVGSRANRNYGITFWMNRSHDGKADIAETGNRIRRLRNDGDAFGTTAVSRHGISPEAPEDLYMAAGAANQRLYIIPSLDMVIVRQGRLTRFDDRKFLGLLLSGLSDR